jgi:nitrite reductase/ring-hydroxylating ferredoxin subunit
MEGFSRVATLESLAPGEMIGAESEGGRVLVANVDGEIVAVSDECPNDSARLSDGLLRGSMVTCPEDGSTYRITDGAPVPVSGLSPRLEVFQTRVSGRTVEVGPRLM